MPRVENIGDNVSAWCDATGEGSTTHDVCKGCARMLDGDPHYHDGDLKPEGWSMRGGNGHEPQGDEGWFEGPWHPDYDEQYPPYTCAVCGDELTGVDD